LDVMAADAVKGSSSSSAAASERRILVMVMDYGWQMNYSLVGVCSRICCTLSVRRQIP
jgi:hypothetical protein